MSDHTDKGKIFPAEQTQALTVVLWWICRYREIGGQNDRKNKFSLSTQYEGRAKTMARFLFKCFEIKVAEIKLVACRLYIWQILYLSCNIVISSHSGLTPVSYKMCSTWAVLEHFEMIKHLLTFGCHAGELNHFFFLNCWQKVTKLPRNISSSFWKCFRSMNSSWLMVSHVTQLVNHCVDYSGWIVKSYLRSVLFTLHNKLMGFYFIVPFSLRCCQAVSARGKRFILKAKHIKIMGYIY